MMRIFLVGCPRSGTTLLQSFLASHTQLVSFTESHFFDKGFRRRMGGGYRVSAQIAPLHRAWAQENGLAADRTLLEMSEGNSAATAGQLASRFIEVLDSAAVAAGRAGWVEKTPDHVFRLDVIREAAPNARIVHLVRRGPDVVKSLRKASAEWGKPRSWSRAAVHWLAAVNSSSRALNRHNDLAVVYDELVRRPEPVLRALLHALGLAWEDSVLARSAAQAVVAPGEVWKSQASGTLLAPKHTPLSAVPMLARTIIGLDRSYRRLADEAESRLIVERPLA